MDPFTGFVYGGRAYISHFEFFPSPGMFEIAEQLVREEDPQFTNSIVNYPGTLQVAHEGIAYFIAHPPLSSKHYISTFCSRAIRLGTRMVLQQRNGTRCACPVPSVPHTPDKRRYS